jgi:hypothetical protein
MTDPDDIDMGSGAGSGLPAVVLVLAGMCTVFAVFVSAMSIHLQLKNYRKPVLQRSVFSFSWSSSLNLNCTVLQNGCTNHGHGPNLRSIFSYSIIFSRGGIRH